MDRERRDFLKQSSLLAGRTIAEVFEPSPELLAVAIIRDQQIHADPP
jgi:hypothetical protein